MAENSKFANSTLFFWQETSPDEDFIVRIVEEVLKENPKAVEDYKKGKEKAIGFLIGKVMAKTKGKANPQKTQEIIKQLITKTE